MIAFGQSSGSQGGESGPQPPSAPSVSVSDAEIEQFTAALVAIQSIQQNAQTEIGKIIQDSSFSRQRFIEIYQARQQSGEQGSEVELSDDEQQAYQQTMSEISEIQNGLQSRVQDAISEEEMEVSRFNEIYSALSQSPEIQERVRSEMQAQQGQSQSGGSGS